MKVNNFSLPLVNLSMNEESLWMYCIVFSCEGEENEEAMVLNSHH